MSATANPRQFSQDRPENFMVDGWVFVDNRHAFYFITSARGPGALPCDPGPRVLPLSAARRQFHHFGMSFSTTTFLICVFFAGGPRDFLGGFLARRL